MKKIFTTTLLMIAFTFLNAQTTLTEFNYLTKGYKIAIESGLDIKKGYSLHTYGDWGKKSGSVYRSTTFTALTRDGEKKPCALLVILERSDNSYKRYACIPHFRSDEDVWTLAYKGWQNTDLSSAYAWGMIQFISYQFSKTEEDIKAEEIINALENE